MQSIAFAVRVLPGQAAANRDALASCRSGVRKEAFEDALRRAGVIRETVWIQTTPNGEVSVVYLEADDIATAFAVLGASPAPFDQWYRENADMAANPLRRMDLTRNLPIGRYDPKP